MSDFNTVILTGRLTADPELRQTTSGTTLCKFSIAVNRRGKDDRGKDDGVDYLNCCAWRQTAEVICRYCKKGSAVLVDGEIHINQWTDKNGSKRNDAEITVRTVQFLGGKSEDKDTAPLLPQIGGTAAENGFTEIDPTDDDLPF